MPQKSDRKGSFESQNGNHNQALFLLTRHQNPGREPETRHRKEVGHPGESEGGNARIDGHLRRQRTDFFQGENGQDATERRNPVAVGASQEQLAYFLDDFFALVGVDFLAGVFFAGLAAFDAAGFVA